MDTIQISNLSVGHVAVRLSVYIFLWLLLDPFSLSFSGGAQCHIIERLKNPNSGKRKKLEEYQVSRNGFLCFTHESAIWAEFSRNNISLLQVASPWVTQKSGANSTGNSLWPGLLARTSTCGFFMQYLYFLPALWLDTRVSLQRGPDRSHIISYDVDSEITCHLCQSYRHSQIQEEGIKILPFSERSVSITFLRGACGTRHHAAHHLGKYNLPQALINTHHEFMNTRLATQMRSWLTETRLFHTYINIFTYAYLTSTW